MKKATRKKLLLLGTLVTMAIGVAALNQVRQARTDKRILEHGKQGMAAYQQQQYEQAIPHLSQYVGRHQDDPEILLAFADARRKVPAEDGSASHLLHALTVTRLALELDPESFTGRAMLMELTAELGYLTEADQAAVGVLSQDPAHLRAHIIRLAAARDTGRDDECIEASLTMAAAIPHSFQVQSLAVNQLIESGFPLDQLVTFVEQRRAALPEGIASELLAAMLAAHRGVNADDPAEGLEFKSQFVEHLNTAISMTPSEPEEALHLVRWLDGAPSIAGNAAADELLERYFDDDSLRPGILQFSVARAWQRSDHGALTRFMDRIPDPAALDDDTLGWLAFGLRDQLQLAELLGTRTTDDANAWSAIIEASQLFDSGHFAEAREHVAPLLTAADAEFPAVARFVDAICLLQLGEYSLATQVLTDLANNLTWVRARSVLSDQAIQRGDHLAAFDLLLQDQLPSTDLLMIETAVALDESGHTWAPYEVSGRARADQTLLHIPDHPGLLSLHARAELAAGNTARVLEVADQLAAMTDSVPDARVVRFADKLEPLDPDRAAALREVFASDTIDPVLRLIRQLANTDLSADQLRAQIKADIDQNDPDLRRRSRMLLAYELDQMGSEDAAAEYAQLAADYPDDARVQLSALESISLWESADAVPAIIGRLRGLTGESGLTWRVFQYRLTLLQDESEAAAARVINDLSSVLRLAPRDVLALQLMAEAMSRVGDNRAPNYAARAADAAPTSLPIALDAIDALAHAGRMEEVSVRLAGLPAIRSDSAQNRLRRAAALSRFGMAPDALPDWAWLADSENPSTRASAAVALTALGQLERAEEVVAELLSLPDASAESRALTAHALAALGRKDQGLALLQATDDPNRQSPAVIANFMAEHATSPGDREQLEQFARATNDPDAWAAAVRLYMGENMLDEARRVLVDALANAKDAAPLATFQRALDPNVALDPLTFFAYAQAGLSKHKEGWAAELAARLEPVVTGKTSLESFETYLRQFVDEHPPIAMGWELLAQAQVTIGDAGAARTTTQAMLQALPSDPSAARFAVRLFENLGMVDEGLLAAREYEARLARPTLKTGRAIAHFALLAGRANEAWDAIAPWQSEIQADTDVLLFTRAALAVGQTSRADALYWEHATDDRLWAHNAIQLAVLIEGTAERSAWLNTAAPRLEGSDEQGRLRLANAWHRLAMTTGDPDALQSALEQTITDASDTRIEALLSLVQGSCLAQLGRHDEAIESYRTTLRLMPDNPDAANNLAYELLLTGGDAEEALQHADHAVKVLSGRGESPTALLPFLDTLGSALLNAERPGEALVVFQETLDTRPDYDYGLVGLAESLVALGRKPEARDTLDQLDSTALPPDLAERLVEVRQAAN
jgi:tetratricopeptide (TPR) repeat protein